jgi:peptide chain release factor 1
VAEGEGAGKAFANEPGGHRHQRVPPNERHGRRHTSTITVAVLPPCRSSDGLNPSDVDVEPYRGSGPGGQHRNKTLSAIRVTHRPTGVTVRCESERSQHQNREMAMAWLAARVAAARTSKVASDENASRRAQVGSGMRGDKVRTVRHMDGIVTNNLNGKKTSLDKYLDGDFSRLF